MELFFNRCSLVWLLLLAATGLTASVAAIDSGWATSTILAIAALKIAFVMGSFMELASAPLVWRYAFGGWLLLIATMLIAAFGWA
jgi:hypothetical protein